MIDEDLAAHAMQCAKGVAFCEVRMADGNGKGIILSNGEVAGVEYAEQQGISVRVVVDGAIGFAATNRMTRTEVRNLVETAVRTARRQHRQTGITFHDIPTVKATWEVPIQQTLPDEEVIIDYLQNIHSNIAETTKATMLLYEDNIASGYYCNLNGSEIWWDVPRLALWYLLTVGDGNKTEQTHREFGNTGGWEHAERWQAPEMVINDVAVLERLITEGQAPPRGDVDMVLAPFVSGLIAHESCGHPFEADRILGREAAQAGKSFVTPDMLNMRIGQPAVSVVDDPTIESSYGHYRYDDEGVAAQKRYLIRDGVIASFLHNRETSAWFGVPSNAAARSASYEREPIVRMANTYIEPGEYTPEELIEGIRYGIYMVTFMEWNIDDRRYNQKYVGEEAYLIENGEVSSMVRHPALEISTPAFYNSIDAVGNDFELYPATCGKGDPMQGLPVCTGGATVRIRGVRIR
jgi:TldD protein